MRSTTRPLVGAAAAALQSERDATNRPRSGGTGRLDRQALLLISVNALFAIANALSGAFVQIYIWKIKPDFAWLGLLAAAHQITMALTFWIAGKWVKEGNKLNALRAGIILAAVFYGIVLALGTRSADYVPLLGFVQGISSGLFWLSFNVLYFEISEPDNRDRFNGSVGLLSSFGGMIVPWISGHLIASRSGNTGYTLIFSLSLTIFLLGATLSFWLHRRKPVGKFDWKLGLGEVAAKGSPWRSIGLGMVAQGLREGVFGFLIGLLLYVATRSEVRLGNFSLITSAVALASFWVTGRVLKPRYRSKGMLAGSLLLVACMLPLLMGVSYGSLLLFGIGTALFMPLYAIPLVSVVFDQIGGDKRNIERREELIIYREISLNAGRLIGTALFIACVSWSTDEHLLILMMFLFGSSPIAASLLLFRRITIPAGQTSS